MSGPVRDIREVLKPLPGSRLVVSLVVGPYSIPARAMGVVDPKNENAPANAEAWMGKALSVLSCINL